MADNIDTLDAALATKTMKTKEISSVHWTQQLISLFVGGVGVPVNGDASGNIGVMTAAAPIWAQPLIANPTSTLTRPANTTAYTAGDVISSNTTAGSVVVPSIQVGRANATGVKINRFRMRSSMTTGMSGINLQVDIWSAAPTFTNGDNGVYAVATGASSYLGTLTFSMIQLADGAVATASFQDGPLDLLLGATQNIYWTVQTLSTYTPTSGQTFILTAEVEQG